MCIRDRIKVDRVVCAVDCGTAINPDNIRSQVEGAVGFALSAAMSGEITLKAGRVEQGNFDGYQLLRIDEMPKVEVHILPSSERPTGIGEPGLPLRRRLLRDGLPTPPRLAAGLRPEMAAPPSRSFP